MTSVLLAEPVPEGKETCHDGKTKHEAATRQQKDESSVRMPYHHIMAFILHFTSFMAHGGKSNKRSRLAPSSHQRYYATCDKEILEAMAIYHVVIPNLKIPYSHPSSWYVARCFIQALVLVSLTMFLSVMKEHSLVCSANGTAP